MLMQCILLSASLCHAVRDPQVVALAITQTAVVVTDAVTENEIEQLYPIGWQEDNPIAVRLMGSRPQMRSMIAWGCVEAGFTMYLGERMKRSHWWIRHVRWAPQLIAIGRHSDGVRMNVLAIRGGMRSLLRAAYTYP